MLWKFDPKSNTLDASFGNLELPNFDGKGFIQLEIVQNISLNQKKTRNTII